MCFMACRTTPTLGLVQELEFPKRLLFVRGMDLYGRSEG